MTGPPDARRTRPFALTAAQTEQGEADERITMHSTIRAAVSLEDARNIPEEWQTVLRMCADPGIAVAEVAARIRMPLTRTVVLLGQLRTAGLIHHQPALTDADAANVPLLRRIRSGLADL